MTVFARGRFVGIGSRVDNPLHVGVRESWERGENGSGRGVDVDAPDDCRGRTRRRVVEERHDSVDIGVGGAVEKGRCEIDVVDLNDGADDVEGRRKLRCGGDAIVEGRLSEGRGVCCGGGSRETRGGATVTSSRRRGAFFRRLRPVLTV